MRRAWGTLVLGLALTACAGPGLEPPGQPAPARFTDTGFVATDGTVLPARVWQPKAPPIAVLLALHGFNDHAGAFATAGPALAARGILVAAYDQRGFGRSPGRGYWPGVDPLLDDARAALKALRERYPDQRVLILGESMGGAVALSAVAEAAPGLVDGVILSAPAVWARETMPWIQRAALWLAQHTVPGLTLSGRGLARYPSDNLAMLQGLSQDPLWIRASRIEAIAGVVDVMDRAVANGQVYDGPLLMLYGLNDQIIPAAPTRAMAIRLPGRPVRQRLAIYPDGWHMLMRDLQAGVVLEDIAAWIRAPDAPLPSAAETRADAFLEGRIRAVEETGPRRDPRAAWEACRTGHKPENLK